MKLRYYLRGLGIGMLVAALVLILSGSTGGGMSDEAVKRRASELGMVEKDKSVLEDVGADKVSEEDGKAQEQPETGEEAYPGDGADPRETEEKPEERTPEEGEAKEPAADGEDAAIPAEPEGGGESSEADPAQSEEQQAVEEIEQRAQEIAERGHEIAENSVPETTVSFVVRHGDSSISVARRAQELGLVVSAADFDVYLCQNGYDKRISVGTYEIAAGASEREIADVITRSR